MTNEASRSDSEVQLDRYDWSRAYRWNYEHAPQQEGSASREDVAPVPGEWSFLGLPVASPLGVAAGPLLNGRWCLYYADRGFDVVTYKTVRSGGRECYPLPNLQPITSEAMTRAGAVVASRQQMNGSWAVSFGMPSSDPDVWRRDVEWTRSRLRADQLLSVSVVGTVQSGWDMDRLAEDYAQCARWAVDSGADCIEANFSCPNVATCDGQLYQDARDSQRVAVAIREAIGKKPLIIKIGYFAESESVHPLVDALDGVVDGLSMTNSIAAKVRAETGEMMFDGEQRGICGDAIRASSIGQVKRFAGAISNRNSSIELIGVGGISAAEHAHAYLAAGAHACHLASSVMVDPKVGQKIRRAWCD